MSSLHRSYNPYSSAPPPPASLPEYVILPESIAPLTDEQAGQLIDSFLETQQGKVLALHRLADHLLGRTQVTNDTGEVEELGHVLEEERRNEGGIVRLQPDGSIFDEGQRSRDDTNVVEVGPDKKRTRKEERRKKKDEKRDKRKRERESGHHEKEGVAKATRKAKDEKDYKQKER